MLKNYIINNLIGFGVVFALAIFVLFFYGYKHSITWDNGIYTYRTYYILHKPKEENFYKKDIDSTKIKISRKQGYQLYPFAIYYYINKNTADKDIYNLKNNKSGFIQRYDTSFVIIIIAFVSSLCIFICNYFKGLSCQK